MIAFWHLISARGAGTAFWCAFMARLPVSMVPIGMVVLVAQVRGSYGLAGLVTAAFTIGAAAGTPLWGAWTDRWGHLPVLAPLSAASAAALVVFTFAVDSSLSTAWLVGLAVAVGALRPPIPAAMRSCWREVVRSKAELHAAYSLEAVVGEVVFITGPMVLSLVVMTGSPLAPLLVAAAFQAVGGVGFSVSAVARRWRSTALPLNAAGAASRGRSPMREPGVALVMLLTVLLGVGFGVFNTALTASAESVFGRKEFVGLLFFAVAGGSAVGGLLYGARERWPGHERQRLGVSVAAFSAGLAALALVFSAASPAGSVASLPVALAVLALMGLPIAAGLVMRSNLVDEHSSSDRLTEAQSWLNTAHSAGSAFGAMWAGVLLDGHGAGAAMAGAAAVVGAGALVCVFSQRVWSRGTAGQLRQQIVAEPAPADEMVLVG